MKTEELTAIGLSDEQANQILAMNGRDIEKHKQHITDLETERDNYKTQFETADAALKKFDGIDPEQIQKELQTYKTKAEEAENKRIRELTQRDQKDWLKAKLDEYGVKSPLARRQITTDIMSEEKGLKWQGAKDDKPAMFFGFDDYMKAAKAEDETLYQTAEEKAAAEKAAKIKKKAPTFTGPAGDSDEGSEKYVPPKIF